MGEADEYESVLVDGFIDYTLAGTSSGDFTNVSLKNFYPDARKIGYDERFLSKPSCCRQ